MTKIEDAVKLVEQKSPNDVAIIHSAKTKHLGDTQSQGQHLVVGGKRTMGAKERSTSHGKASSCLLSSGFSKVLSFFS